MNDRPEKPAGSQWTDEQWQAIIERDDNVLVSAAAGSGKTAVLVERILRIILDERNPVDVDRLLVATFTKAAADEMRHRMRQALEARLSGGAASPHLRRQLALLHRASFTTLHSFCMEVISRHYARIPLDPGFRVANETEAELLRQDALDGLFEIAYEEEARDSPFWGLLERYGGQRGDEGLYALILKLYDFSRSHPFPDEWLRTSAETFATFSADKDHPLMRQMLAEAAFVLEDALFELREAEKWCRSPGGPDVWLEAIAAENGAIGAMLAAAERGDWNAIRERLASGVFDRLKPARGDQVDKQLAEKARSARDRAKKRLQDLGKQLFARSPEELATEMRQAAPYMIKLAELAVRFGRRYADMKKAKRLLDFADLEHFALKVLCAGTDSEGNLVPAEAALEYREQFAEILIDEFQDINQVQEAILSLIARPERGNRFMVGDVKQSIYRFRLADPGIFQDKYKSYLREKPAGTGETGIAIGLARNFRSRRNVVDAVNFLFRQIMDERAAEIEYDRQAELVYGARYPDPHDPGAMATEIHILHRGEDEDSPAESQAPEAQEAEGGLDELHELETAELEARFIAMRIRELTGDAGKPAFRVWDKVIEGYRDATYRDIVILLRATSAWAPVFAEQLGHFGIPCHAELSSGYFDAVEVDMMLSLLQIIDNPLQDIPLAGVLRSPVVGLSAEQLAQIRLADPSGTYYEAMLKFMKDEEPRGKPAEDARIRLADFCDRLSTWRKEAEGGKLSDLIWRIYRETGLYDYMGGLPGGQQRQANLKALYDRARQFESTSLRGLFRFLRFIRRMRESGSDLGAAKTLGEQDNVVRIMSIHKSKGLEFPLVIVAGLSKMFNRQDTTGEFLLHKELGFGPMVVDPTARISYPSLARMAIERRLRMETVAEEMRILYVALTRAKEKLILVGTTRNVGQLVERWSPVASSAEGRLPSPAIAGARCFLDWIGPAVLRHPSLADFRRAWNMPATGPFVIPDPSDITLRIVPQSRLGAMREAAAASRVDRDWVSRVAGGEPLPAPEGKLILSGKAEAERDRIPGAVERLLGWSYPHDTASRLHAKIAVTEVKRLWEQRRLEEDESLPGGELTDIRTDGADGLPSGAGGSAGRRSGAFSRRPRFLSEQTANATERGSAYHAVMQHIPLKPDIGEEDVLETIKRLTDKEILLPSQAAEIEPSPIAGFFRTDMGQRLLRSGNVRREVPFSYAMPAAEIHRDAGEGLEREKVLIQGVLDCLFEEEGELVLIDYKTDRVYGNPVKFAEKYRVQLELYARAVGAILGKPVRQKALYFFDGGHLVVL